MSDKAMGWTVGRRVTYGFAISVVLLVIVGVIGGWALTRAVNAYEGALTSRRSILVPVHRAETEVRGADVALLRQIITGDARSGASADSAIAVARSLLTDAHTADVGEGEQGERRGSWALVLSTIEEWARAVDEAKTARERGDQTLALSIRDSRVEPIRARLADAMSTLALSVSKSADEKAAQSSDNARAARTVLIVGVILALMIAILSAVLISKSINRPLQESANVIAATAAEILAATTQQAAGINESMAAVTETVATVDEVAQTAAQAAQRAKSLAEASQRAADTGSAGRVAVQRSITAMRAVESEVDGIAKGIVTLAEQASAIGEITSAVSDIAEQTRLLALNAAVEAARAGENGRGFAVVAAEIKALAGQAKDSTTQVARILSEIQRATSAAVMATEQGTKQTAAASHQAVEAGEIIAQLADVAAEASQTAAQIAASAGQQALGMEQIRQAIGNIHEATQQHLTATRQSETAAENLSSLGSRLIHLVGNG